MSHQINNRKCSRIAVSRVVSCPWLRFSRSSKIKKDLPCVEHASQTRRCCHSSFPTTLIIENVESRPQCKQCLGFCEHDFVYYGRHEFRVSGHFPHWVWKRRNCTRVYARALIGGEKTSVMLFLGNILLAGWFMSVKECDFSLPKAIWQKSSFLLSRDSSLGARRRTTGTTVALISFPFSLHLIHGVFRILHV